MKKLYLVLAVFLAVGIVYLLSLPRQAAPPDLYTAKPGDPLPGLSGRQKDIFSRGRELFTRRFRPADGLGPRFNGRSCYECHGSPGVVGGSGSDAEDSTVTLVGALRASSKLAADLDLAREQVDRADFSPMFGEGGPVVQRRSITAEFAKMLPPDCRVETGRVPAAADFVSKRYAPSILGAGLIAAVDEEAILANMMRQSRQFPDLVGRVNAITDPLTGETKPGRFGWKAQQPDLLTATAEELDSELGVTSFLRVTPPQVNPVPRCLEDYVPDHPEMAGDMVASLSGFPWLLAPPPAPELTADAKKGEELFVRTRCASCHTPELYTPPVVMMPDPSSPFPRIRYLEVKALEDQPVRLYSDLLLHDMGPALADGIVQGTARGGEWRTTPLWGLRWRQRFLHDGRAATIEEAILAHGGQAASVREAYRSLEDADRRALLAFLSAL